MAGAGVEIIAGTIVLALVSDQLGTQALRRLLLAGSAIGPGESDGCRRSLRRRASALRTLGRLVSIDPLTETRHDRSEKSSLAAPSLRTIVGIDNG
jgi:hypothetical protein